MEHASRDLFVTFRRILATLLLLSLLVAFWADRPIAAQSRPLVNEPAAAGASTAASSVPPTSTEIPSTSLIGLLRRPWLQAYTLLGAPPLDGGKLTPEQEDQFRRAVGRLAAVFFAGSFILWWQGRRIVAGARRT